MSVLSSARKKKDIIDQLEYL